MRFSSIFQLPAVAAEPSAAPEAVLPASPGPAAVAQGLPELPEDLDARVRLVGEWQWLLD